MRRFMSLLACVLTGVVLAIPASADDPPKKLTPEEQKALFAKWTKLMDAGEAAYEREEYVDAMKAFRAALELARELYPLANFPDGHANLASSLSNLGMVYEAQGKPETAELLYKDALKMRRRVFPVDHADIAIALNQLADLYRAQGKYADAETLCKECLEMRKRLFKGDHPTVAISLNNLALLYKLRAKHTEAEAMYKEALAMNRRLFKGDHFDVAANLNNLANLYADQGKYAQAEPLYNDALAMIKKLFKGDHPQVAIRLINLAGLYQDQGKYAEAELRCQDALKMITRNIKGDHPYLAATLSRIAELYRVQGKVGGAEPFDKAALEMTQRLFKGDHPYVANSLNNMAVIYQAQGRYAEAEPLLKNGLGMRKRLFKGDHPDVARSLNNLAALYWTQRKYADAEPLYKSALEMRKRLYKGDHPDVADSLDNLAVLYKDCGKLADAEPRYKSALEMRRRLFKGDHLTVATSLNNLAGFYWYCEKYAKAEPLCKEALEMDQRLFKGDHPYFAISLNNMGRVYHAQNRLADAEPLVRQALAMSRRLTIAFANQKAIGEALTLIASQPVYRDHFLSIARARESDPRAIYTELWVDKGSISRVYESRFLQARAVDANFRTLNILADLIDARRRRAELLLAPVSKDPATQTKREGDIKLYEDRIEELNRVIGPLLPTIKRVEKLAAASPSDLQKVLPADAALIDFIRFTHFEYEKNKSGKAGEKRTRHYLAFVVTKEKIAWVLLDDTAEEIDNGVKSWREAITQRKKVPAEIAAKTRELVWEKIGKELPSHINTLYICPDADLCRVPWAALPGDKPDTILLEQYAIATIPHASFLLDAFWPQEPLKNPKAGALAVGGVKYDAELTPPTTPKTVGAEPLMKPNALVEWKPLTYSGGEADGFAVVGRNNTLSVTTLTEEKATAEAVLTALPKVRYAHLATHGFFADPSFRFVFNLNEKDYENRFGERIGRAANSPLVMSGLVFAGANNPKTPSYGIVTGEALIDLDLSGLELAVLSACETGLGDVADGEGTFSLQRAFHMAGTRNVVASLWKVPDLSTAALMGRFYHYLWVKNLSAMESLRQAQLDIYRNPDKIAAWAKEFGGEPGGDESAEPKPVAGGKSHPKKWAAFVLSGPGR